MYISIFGYVNTEMSIKERQVYLMMMYDDDACMVYTWYSIIMMIMHTMMTWYSYDMMQNAYTVLFTVIHTVEHETVMIQYTVWYTVQCYCDDKIMAYTVMYSKWKGFFSTHTNSPDLDLFGSYKAHKNSSKFWWQPMHEMVKSNSVYSLKKLGLFKSNSKSFF